MFLTTSSLLLSLRVEPLEVEEEELILVEMTSGPRLCIISIFHSHSSLKYFIC